MALRNRLNHLLHHWLSIRLNRWLNSRLDLVNHRLNRWLNRLDWQLGNESIGWDRIYWDEARLLSDVDYWLVRSDGSLAIFVNSYTV